MIVFEQVTKYYPTKQGRKYALQDVSFAIDPKAHVGLLGVNGSGKSTLIRLIGKIDFPNAGRIHCPYTVSWPVGLATAYQGSMTGRENTRFVGKINGIEHLKDLEHEVATFAELGDYFDMPVNTYSSGMKSRFAFALSMAISFDIYLIDEVTAAGDQRFREKSQKALEAKRAYAGFFMVSHNLNEISRLCQVALLLRDGRLVYYDDVTTAIKDYKKSL